MDEILTVKELLDQLREPKKKHSNPFVELLPKAQELLELGSKLDTISLEALLIQAIIYCVFDNEDEPDKISKEDAKKRDSYLLAMGLLDEYYHSKSDGTHYAAHLRHKDYLARSQYKEISYEKEIMCGLLSVEDVHVNAKSALSTTDRRCREKLADYLSKSENCKRCFEKGSEKFIEKVELPNKEIKRQLIIPKPRYTRKNFPLPIKQGNGASSHPPSMESVLSGNDSSAEKSIKHDDKLDKEVVAPTIIELTDSDMPDSTNDVISNNESVSKPNIESLPPAVDSNSVSTDNEISNGTSTSQSSIEDEPNDKTEKEIEESIEQTDEDNKTETTERKLIAFLSILLASGLVLALTITLIIVGYCVVSQNKINLEKEAAEKIVPTKIEIMEKNIMLPLGGDGYLIVETEPDELNQNDLCYISSCPDIVRMEDIHSKHMIATDELAADARNYSDIVVHDIDGIAQDTATVIVRKTRKNEAAIDDKNDDEASSTGFEANIDSE